MALLEEMPLLSQKNVSKLTFHKKGSSRQPRTQTKNLRTEIARACTVNLFLTSQTITFYGGDAASTWIALLFKYIGNNKLRNCYAKEVQIGTNNYEY